MRTYKNADRDARESLRLFRNCLDSCLMETAATHLKNVKIYMEESILLKYKEIEKEREEAKKAKAKKK